jgi:putative Mn2+ efflux pump MntP
MPLIGLGLGAPLAHAIGGIADYLAAAALIALGTWMLLAADSDEHDKAGQLANTHGLAVIGLGISVRLDELAIGFSLGLSRLPATPVIIAIAVQAFLAAQLGLRLGARISERMRQGAAHLAGAILAGLGLFLIVEHLLHY